MPRFFFQYYLLKHVIVIKKYRCKTSVNLHYSISKCYRNGTLHFQDLEIVFVFKKNKVEAS